MKSIVPSSTTAPFINPRFPLPRPGWPAGLTLVCMALILLTGCGKPEPGHGATDTRKVEVGYVVVTPANVPVTIELGARTNAYHTSEVRPQVSGIIQRRLFTEGAEVRKGQTLYRIDPALYAAAVTQAKAGLAGARANAAASTAKARRYRELEATHVISQQDYADALAQAELATAAVQQAEAALNTAEINLRFTTVPAPISGRIGRSLFTEGALVTANQADPLAIIQQLDPMAVDIQQSSSDVLTLRRSLSREGVIPASAEVHLKLPDGSEYGRSGTLEFAEATVDENTGTITLRARFDNPDGLLLPGMFVRAVFAQMVDTRALLVPQAGVTRDPRGNASVLIVGDDDKVVRRDISTNRVLGTDWVVTAGLKPGDRVITEGIGKVGPGVAVKPVAVGPAGQSGS